jgi:hypothetical protein
MRRDPAELRQRAQRLLRQQSGEPDAATPAATPAPPPPVPPVSAADVARAEDYALAEPGGRAVGARAPSQKIQLLLQFREAGPEGLTDEQAGTRAGLLASCFWHRCTDLRSEGWIEFRPDGKTIKGNARVRQRVSVITNEGLTALQRREM